MKAPKSSSLDGFPKWGHLRPLRTSKLYLCHYEYTGIRFQHFAIFDSNRSSSWSRKAAYFLISGVPCRWNHHTDQEECRS